MGELLPLIRDAAGTVGLADDIAAIEGLVALFEKWERARPQIDGIDSVETLLDAVAADAESEAVVAAFEALGLGGVRAKIGALLGKVKGVVADLPEWARTLAKPMGSFDAATPGMLSWKPLDVARTQPLGGEFSLGGEASVEFNTVAAVKWADGGGTDPLIRVGVKGAIWAEASGAVPYPMGAFKAGAKASADVDLDYYFDADEKALYGLELVKRVPQIPDPFDYAAVWEAFQRPEFAGLSYSFASAASANVELSLAYLGTPTKGKGLKLDLSAKVSIGAEFKRGYKLTLRRGPAVAGVTSVIAAMSRSALDTRELKASIGLTVDFPILRAQVEKVINQALAAWDKGVAELKPFLSPGTYLQKVAGSQIEGAAGALFGNAPLRDAVKKDLKGAFGIDTSNDLAVKDWLQGRIKDAIDTNWAALVKEPEALVAKVTADLDFVPAEAREFAKGEVERLVKLARTALDGAVADVVRKFDRKGDQLGKLLGDLGAKAEGAVTGADDAFERVREIFDRYNALVHDVAKKAKEAAEKKVTLSIYAQNKRSRELQVKIAGSFVGPDASEMFTHLTRGELSALIAIVRTKTAPAGFILDGPNSSYSEQATLESEGGYEAVFFGFGAKRSVSLTADAKVLVDGDGNVQIDTEAELKKRFSAGGETREVSFADTLGIAIAGGGQKDTRPSITRTIKLGLSVSYHDEELAPKELDRFLSELEKPELALISPQTGAAARERLASWIPADATHADVDIRAQLWVDNALAQKMLRLAPGERDGGRERPLRLGMRRQIMRAGLAALIQGGATTQKRIDRALEWINSQHEEPHPETFVEGVLSYYVAVIDGKTRVKALYDDFAKQRKMPPDELEEFRRVARQLTGLVQIIDRAGAAYLSTPAGDDPKGDEWTVDDYFDAQVDIVNGSREWLATNQFLILWSKDGVAPPTIAFMLALEKLAGDLPYPVALSLTNHAGEGEPETVAL